MGNKYSIHDDRPEIFFKETINGVPFVFDNEYYSSVEDCFNQRKISKNMWNPKTVPSQQQINLEPIGFLLDSDKSKMVSIEDSDLTKKQFSTLVKAQLFILYFDSIVTDSVSKSKYYCSYQACKKLVDSIHLEECKVDLTDYWIPDVEILYGNININVNSLRSISYFNDDNIRNLTSVTITDKSLLNIKNITAVLRSLKSERLNIIITDQNTFNDSTWIQLNSMGYLDDAIIADGIMNYKDNLTLSFGSMPNADINWDNVILLK